MSLRASFVYIAVRAVTGLLSVAALSLFVRGLGPEEYGHLTLGLAAAALASTVLIMPLNTTLARLYGDGNSRARVLATLLGAVLGIGLILSMFAFVLELLGASWLAPWVLPSAALFAAAQGSFDFSAQRANSALETRRYGSLLLVRAGCIITLGAVAVMVSSRAPAVLLAMAFACVISIAANMRGRFRIRDFDAALAPRIASFALPLVITCGLSYLLQWGDRYVLARLVSLGELGRYSALADLTQQTLVLVCSGLGAAWYPRIVQAWGGGQRGEAQRLLSRYALMGLAFVMPAAVGFAMLLRPVAMLMFGAAYGDLPAGLPVLLVLAAVAGGCKSFYFDVPMLLAERVWRLASGIAISASVSLAVMAWAVPIQGIRGAALGLLCGQLVGLVYSFAMGRDVLRHQVGLQQVLCVVAASAVMALVLALVAFEGAFGLVARIILGSLAYGSILLLADFDGARLRLANFVRARAGAGR